VSELEFNIPFQHKYGYIRDESGSSISWTMCKSFAPRSRQITMPAPHHSIFTSRMLFLTPNQQCQIIDIIM